MSNLRLVSRLVLALLLVGAIWLYFSGVGPTRQLFPGGAEGRDVFSVAPQTEPEISPLTQGDRDLLMKQRGLVDDLVRRHTGVSLGGGLRDLDSIQNLVDRDTFDADQTFELQALGVALGDVMAQNLGLRWVIFRDAKGTSRALQWRTSENLFFPTTMISKRIEREVAVDVRALYEKTAAAVERLEAGDGLSRL